MSAAPPRGRPAVFLDRDGTLTVEEDWVAAPAELVLQPGVAPPLRRLAAAGFALVVVTNQSAVARGIVDEAGLARVHDRLRALLAAQDVRLDGVFTCPHHPDEGAPPYRRACGCRKPEPGLLYQARDALGLDLAHSWIVGDAERDLAAGERAGVAGVLVATGKGAREHARLAAAGRAPAAYVPDLDAAATWILERAAQGR